MRIFCLQFFAGSPASTFRQCAGASDKAPCAFKRQGNQESLKSQIPAILHEFYGSSDKMRTSVFFVKLPEKFFVSRRGKENHGRIRLHTQQPQHARHLQDRLHAARSSRARARSFKPHGSPHALHSGIRLIRHSLPANRTSNTQGTSSLQARKGILRARPQKLHHHGKERSCTMGTIPRTLLITATKSASRRMGASLHRR